MSRPIFARDLSERERYFLDVMDDLGFGRVERTPIENGELVLDPWPTTIRGVKFGAENHAANRTKLGEFELKAPVAEFFEYVRSVKKGEIRCLELRHGLPFHMEIAQQPEAAARENRG